MTQPSGGKPQWQDGSRAHPTQEDAYSPIRYGEDQGCAPVETGVRSCPQGCACLGHRRDVSTAPWGSAAVGLPLDGEQEDSWFGSPLSSLPPISSSPLTSPVQCPPRVFVPCVGCPVFTGCWKVVVALLCFSWGRLVKGSRRRRHQQFRLLLVTLVLGALWSGERGACLPLLSLRSGDARALRMGHRRLRLLGKRLCVIVCTAAFLASLVGWLLLGFNMSSLLNPGPIPRKVRNFLPQLSSDARKAGVLPALFAEVNNKQPADLKAMSVAHPALRETWLTGFRLDDGEKSWAPATDVLAGAVPVHVVRAFQKGKAQAESNRATESALVADLFGTTAWEPFGVAPSPLGVAAGPSGVGAASATALVTVASLPKPVATEAPVDPVAVDSGPSTLGGIEEAVEQPLVVAPVGPPRTKEARVAIRAPPALVGVALEVEPQEHAEFTRQGPVRLEIPPFRGRMATVEAPLAPPAAPVSPCDPPVVPLVQIAPRVATTLGDPEVKFMSRVDLTTILGRMVWGSSDLGARTLLPVKRNTQELPAVSAINVCGGGHVSNRITSDSIPSGWWSVEETDNHCAAAAFRLLVQGGRRGRFSSMLYSVVVAPWLGLFRWFRWFFPVLGGLGDSGSHTFRWLALSLLREGRMPGFWVVRDFRGTEVHVAALEVRCLERRSGLGWIISSLTRRFVTNRGLCVDCLFGVPKHVAALFPGQATRPGELQIFPYDLSHFTRAESRHDAFTVTRGMGKDWVPSFLEVSGAPLRTGAIIVGLFVWQIALLVLYFFFAATICTDLLLELRVMFGGSYPRASDFSAFTILRHVVCGRYSNDIPVMLIAISSCLHACAVFVLRLWRNRRQLVWALRNAQFVGHLRGCALQHCLAKPYDLYVEKLEQCLCGVNRTHCLGVASNGLRPSLPIPSEVSDVLAGVNIAPGASAEGVKVAVAISEAAMMAAGLRADQEMHQLLLGIYTLRAHDATRYAAKLSSVLELATQHDVDPLWVGGLLWQGVRLPGQTVIPYVNSHHVLRGRIHIPSTGSDDRYAHEADDIAAGTEGFHGGDGLDAYQADEPEPQAPPFQLPESDDPVFSLDVGMGCLSCGKVLDLDRKTKSDFCKTCSKKGFCRNAMRGGLLCGWPLLFGKCGVCSGEITRDLIRNNAMGGVGPVLPAPVAIDCFCVPPTTLLKDANKVPFDNEQSLVSAIQSDGTLAPGRSFDDADRLKARSRFCKLSRPKGLNWHAGPACFGVSTPAIPLVSARDRATHLATVSGRLMSREPDPVNGAWSRLIAWTKINWVHIFGGERAFRAPRFLPLAYSERGFELQKRWAKSFHPEAKAAKKLASANLFRSRGLLPEDLDWKGMPKLELSQASSKGFANVGQPQRSVHLDHGSNVTGQSGRACQRMLRCSKTGVTEVVLGPDCSIAAKLLGKKWSGNHFIWSGGSRNTHQTGNWFLKAEARSNDSFIGRDFTLFDSMMGFEAHDYFFWVMRTAGFFRSPECITIFQKMFPQRVVWAGVGTFKCTSGMGSGAVYTYLMNSIINGCLTTFSAHRSWAERQGYDVVDDTTWMYTFLGFLSSTGYMETVSGDDSATVGRGLAILEPRTKFFIEEFGHRVKCFVVPSLFHLGYLGRVPVPSERWVGGAWQRCMTMAPIPQRFFNTFGYSIARVKKPGVHLGGVALGYCPSISHLPMYQEYLSVHLSTGEVSHCALPGHSIKMIRVSQAVRKARDDLVRDWGEYCGGSQAEVYRCAPDTLEKMSIALRVSVDTITSLARDFSNVPSLPCYVGTPAMHEIMRCTLEI